MNFVFDDGGRAASGFKGRAGDCVTRAIAIAAQVPYLEVYEALSARCRTQRQSKRKARMVSARDGVDTRRAWFKDYMAQLGFRWTATMRIGRGCEVHLADGELPAGRLIVAVSRHYTAVIDGVIHDTHDPQREVHCLSSYDGRALKPGERLIQSGPHERVASIQRRCVYGYWERRA